MSNIGTLRQGSAGAAVLQAKKALQKLFPQAIPLSDAPLFDFHMFMRVMSMQAKLNRPQDGILTDQLLADFEQYLRIPANITPPWDAGDVARPETILAAREAIVDRARMELNQFGFPKSLVETITKQVKNKEKPDFGDRIVAGVRSEGTLRQGGLHLSTIYQIAGAYGGGCMVLTDKGKTAFETKDTTGRNKFDVGSWCGIFAVYCYKMAGLQVSPWSLKGCLRFSPDDPQAEFRELTAKEIPQKGDIGLQADRNHHLVVVNADAQTVWSIDGNTGEPSVGASIIAETKRSRSDITTVLSPIWERILPKQA